MARFSLFFVLAFAACGAFAQDACCSGKDKAAEQKVAVAEEKACCRSTEAKPIAKGAKGCCNEKGATAKYKVYVAGQGYRYFGCSDSAAKGRKELLASGLKAGKVQKVTSKARI